MRPRIKDGTIAKTSVLRKETIIAAICLSPAIPNLEFFGLFTYGIYPSDDQGNEADRLLASGGDSGVIRNYRVGFKQLTYTWQKQYSEITKMTAEQRVSEALLIGWNH